MEYDLIPRIYCDERIIFRWQEWLAIFGWHHKSLTFSGWLKCSPDNPFFPAVCAVTRAVRRYYWHRHALLVLCLRKLGMYEETAFAYYIAAYL